MQHGARMITRAGAWSRMSARSRVHLYGRVSGRITAGFGTRRRYTAHCRAIGGARCAAGERYGQ